MIPSTWWEWLGVIASIFTIISFVIYLIAFGGLPTDLSSILSIVYWPFNNGTITLPRWILFLLFVFATLKIWDWRRAILDTLHRIYLFFYYTIIRWAQYFFLSHSQKKAMRLNFDNACFLDWNGNTWNNNISQLGDLKKIKDGYELTINIPDGYEYKMILFDKEDIKSSKMITLLTVEEGSVEIALRPRDLSPHGTVSRLYKGTYYVEFWVENEKANILINGEPKAILENKSENYGHYSIMTRQKCTVVFHKLLFLNYRGLGTKKVEDPMKSSDLSRAIQKNESQKNDLNRLIIEKAIYGSGAGSKDVTELIRKYIINEHLFLLIHNYNLGGDPCPNMPKSLTINYVFNNMSATKSANENSSLEIP